MADGPHAGAASGEEAAATGWPPFFETMALKAGKSCFCMALQFETAVFSSLHTAANALFIGSFGATSPESSVSSCRASVPLRATKQSAAAPVQERGETLRFDMAVAHRGMG